MARKKASFTDTIEKAYSFDDEAILLGTGVHDGEAHTSANVRIPLANLNRHGLIAGATGTGKTRTLQLIAEKLSLAGVPSLVMDVKGDLGGLAVPGESNAKIKERHDSIGTPHEPSGFPVEMLTLSEGKGARLRATVTEFGPVLLARILGLNDTQTGILSVIFKFCDDHKLLLLDLEDLKKALHFAANDGASEIEEEYGRISKASTGTILRKVVALEQQAAEVFFGERSFDVEDLVRIDDKGRGIISLLRLDDIQNKPDFFSTFMLQLTAEVYEKFPEEGDLDRPKLVIFIDEAHLIFSKASKALLEQLEMIVKLIRSKGVGLIFCTQNPTDVPDAVLSQLGLKVQHALRAFTAKDRRAIKKSAENFPLTEFYETDQLLTEMGIGEALITGLGPKGKPTPLVHTLLCAPASRMGVLKSAEEGQLLKQAQLIEKYSEDIDRESAYEILSKRMEDLDEASEAEAKKKSKRKAKRKSRSRREEKSTLGKIMDSSLARQVGRTVARELTRGLLGVVGIKTSRRRSSSWF